MEQRYFIVTDNESAVICIVKENKTMSESLVKALQENFNNENITVNIPPYELYSSYDGVEFVATIADDTILSPYTKKFLLTPTYLY